MADTKPTRRRWFQFSLTSLFVLTTLVAVWLAWELNFIRERKVWLTEHPALVAGDAQQRLVVYPAGVGGTGVAGGAGGSGGTAGGGGGNAFVPAPPTPPRDVSIPWWRTALGDAAVPTIINPGFENQELAQVERLFPEAEIKTPPGAVGLTFTIDTTQSYITLAIPNVPTANTGGGGGTAALGEPSSDGRTNDASDMPPGGAPTENAATPGENP